MDEKDITIEMMTEKKPEELIQMLGTMDHGKYQKLVPYFVLVHEARNIVLIYKYLRKKIIRRKIKELHLGSSNMDVSDFDLESIQVAIDTENETDNEWPELVQVCEEAQRIYQQFDIAEKKLDQNFGDLVDEFTMMFIKMYLNKAKLDIKRKIFNKH